MRTLLDLLKPSHRIINNQQWQKEYYDIHTKVLQFSVEDSVWVENLEKESVGLQALLERASVMWYIKCLSTTKHLSGVVMQIN